MIEGRSGGSGRGTRRELWPPPDSGSAQPTDRRFVSCTTLDPEPFPAPPSHFLPSAASSPSHLPAGHGEKFRRTERTFSSALVSAEWRAQRENDRRKERGILAGHPKRDKLRVYGGGHAGLCSLARALSATLVPLSTSCRTV